MTKFPKLTTELYDFARVPMRSNAFLCVPMRSCAFLCVPVCNCALLCAPMRCCAFLCICIIRVPVRSPTYSYLQSNILCHTRFYTTVVVPVEICIVTPFRLRAKLWTTIVILLLVSFFSTSSLDQLLSPHTILLWASACITAEKTQKLPQGKGSASLSRAWTASEAS